MVDFLSLLDIDYLFFCSAGYDRENLAFLILNEKFTKKEWNYILDAVNQEELSSSNSQNSDSAHPNETTLDVDDPITGHIDLIQIDYEDLYILDYITKSMTQGAQESFDSCINRISTNQNATYLNFNYTSAERRSLSK